MKNGIYITQPTGNMATSGDIALLMKVAELGRRFGLRAFECEATTGYVDEDKDPEGKGYTYLNFGRGMPTDPDIRERFEKMEAILGVKDGMVKREYDCDLEDLLDHALSLAPRARAR